MKTLRLLALMVAALAGAAGDARASSGGPDAFGYTWRDSNEPGVTFAFEDISMAGTVISGAVGDDANYGFQTLSFRFPYYGGLYSQVAACSNGWISLVDDLSASFNNSPLPLMGAPRGVIAAYWDDLNVPAGASVRFKDAGDHAIIQWTDVQNLSASAVTNTFQVILRSNGVIDVAYLRVDAPTTSCTIGIENPAETAGLQAWFDSVPGPPGSGYLVQFSPPPPVPATLDCAGAAPLSCNDAIPGDLTAGAALQSRYACTPTAYDGREQVYRIGLPAATPMRVWLETVSGDPDLILLDGCDPNVCIAATGDSVSSALHGGTWYAVVDSRAGQEGAYRIRAECLGFTFCGDALLESSPSANPDHPSWNTEDGSWLVEGWLYHPFDADDYALRVDGGAIYDDRGSIGCTPFPSMTHGVLGAAGPAFTLWSAPEGSLRLDLSQTTKGGCCGLLVDMTVTNTDTAPHYYDVRIFYDTAFGNAAVQPPGCSFVDAVDGGPVEVAGTRYLTEQDLLALGADTCEGQLRMFTAEDPAWLRSSWEMLGANLPTDWELMAWGDGDTPAIQWSGFVNGVVVGDCVGDNSLLLIWRIPAGSGTLMPGESQHALFRIGWECAFPCDSCEYPVLGNAGSQVNACLDGIVLSWDAATFPGAGNGAYHVYRSDVSFADALTRGPVALGLTSPSFVDTTAVSGTDYWYVIQAEAVDYPGCGTGPQVSGSTDEIQLGPVRADPDVTPPAATVGSALRATAHTNDTVDFNWLLAPLPAPGEHYVVLRSDDDPRGPFVVVATPATQRWTDPAAPARFSPVHCWFYDVRVADDCGNTSTD